MMEIDDKLILENSNKLNILYVEDNKQLRESTMSLFKNFFNSVETAFNGEDGYEKYLKHIENEKTPYDIVISDINMPNMNGLEMCKKIKTVCFEQVIVYITAYNEVDYLQEAINIGASGFLIKPLDLGQLKRVLYSASQVVADRKLVVEHCAKIEDSNILSLDLHDARSLNNATDILDDLIENKEKISHLWTEEKVVNERLELHSIDVEFFRSHYGIKVVEYFLDVIGNKAKIGNCPVIFVMLEFFKNKELPLEDIFMICVLFKNTITSYVFSKYSFNKKLYDDISLILDKNFEGVIKNYPNVEDKRKLLALEGSEPMKEKGTKETLVESSEYINYVEYVIESDIYELQDLEEDIDSLSISVTESSSSTIEDCMMLGANITRYGTILGNYPLFSDLGVYIKKLGINFSDNAELLFYDKERMINISALIEGFVNDLIVWRKEIFENNIEDYHFLDSSIFSNVDTIIMFIEYDESAQEEEVFDDDMFF